MSRTIYALLVGINDYLGGVTGLNGCVNDVKRMAEFLQLRTQGGEFELKPLTLTSGDRANASEVKPTRQVVIDGFRTHLCQAGPDDVALFYYSGHGSQEKAPPELWHLEPDHLDETLVCYDSRTDGQWDLADKELGLLIAEVARKKPHIVVILDSCHSGSGTRAPAEPGVRLAPNDKRERPLSSFEGFAQLPKGKAVEPGKPDGGEWLVLPEGKHVVLSACRPEEVANERFLGDDIHGVMSYYLLEALRRSGTSLTYRDAFTRVGTLVRNQVAQQNPVIEASDVKQLQEPFLGGAVKPQPDYFSLDLRQDRGLDNQWRRGQWDFRAVQGGDHDPGCVHRCYRPGEREHGPGCHRMGQGDGRRTGRESGRVHTEERSKAKPQGRVQGHRGKPASTADPGLDARR